MTIDGFYYYDVAPPGGSYTEELHVSYLLQLLSTPNPCLQCPTPPFKMWVLKACPVCRMFVGITQKLANPYYRARCPCYALGPEEAIKRTWLALEAGGYLE